MILKKITCENKSDLEFIEKLYIESFPRNERRPILEMHHLVKDERRFNLFLLETKDNVRIGFVSYWLLNNFIFIEHLAVTSEFRNVGFGNKAVAELIKQTDLPLIAEIELPTTSDLANRREKFYKRLGFEIWNLPYKQPPYEDGFEAIPMYLVTYRFFNFPSDFNRIADVIYTEVYKCKTK